MQIEQQVLTISEISAQGLLFEAGECLAGFDENSLIATVDRRWLKGKEWYKRGSNFFDQITLNQS